MRPRFDDIPTKFRLPVCLAGLSLPLPSRPPAARSSPTLFATDLWPMTMTTPGTLTAFGGIIAAAADVSPHGLVISLLQFGVVLLTWYLDGRWRAHVARLGETPTWRIPIVLGLALLVEYAALRVQPHFMGGRSFVYSLGVFDGVTLVGLAGLVLLHRRNQTKRPA